MFIIICLCSIYCRKKFESSRSLRNDAQPAKECILSRNGNGCCVEQSSASLSQQANATGGAMNEIELAVLCPSSPIETNPHSDAKVIKFRDLLKFIQRIKKEREEELFVCLVHFNISFKEKKDFAIKNI